MRRWRDRVLGHSFADQVGVLPPTVALAQSWVLTASAHLRLGSAGIVWYLLPARIARQGVGNVTVCTNARTGLSLESGGVAERLTLRLEDADRHLDLGIARAHRIGRPYLGLTGLAHGAFVAVHRSLSVSGVARQWDLVGSSLLLDVADRAGVKAERPERRCGRRLDAGEGRRRLRQRRERVGHRCGITSSRVVRNGRQGA
jgi:hypothetical protein